MICSISDIENRFEEAAQTLRRLADIGGARGHGSGWPEVVRAAHSAHGYHDARPLRITPSPAAISRMEEVFDWLRLVDPEDAPDRLAARGRRPLATGLHPSGMRPFDRLAALGVGFFLNWAPPAA